MESFYRFLKKAKKTKQRRTINKMMQCLWWGHSLPFGSWAKPADVLRRNGYSSLAVCQIRSPPTMGCCESWGSGSCGSGIEPGGPRRRPRCRPAPSWRSDPQCCRCTTWPSQPGTAAPGGPRCTLAGLQSPVPGSPAGQRRPEARRWRPAGPWARRRRAPAYSGTDHRI